MSTTPPKPHDPINLDERSFLNLPGHGSLAAYHITTDTSYDGEVVYGYDLAITDCNRKIVLSFGGMNHDRENTFYKVNLLIDALTRIRDNLLVIEMLREATQQALGVSREPR